jgi:hypothetical protein
MLLLKLKNMSTIYLWNPDPPSDSCFDEEPKQIEFPRKLNLFKISNIEFEDVDYKDYPDFCDAFISSADMDGIPMTEEELEKLNEDKCFVFEKLFDKLF